MARERGSTGYSTDVLDAEKMAAAPQVVPTTASSINTLRSVAAKKGKTAHRDCNSNQEGEAVSVALGKWPRSTTPPRRGWQSLHWSGVIKSYVIAVEVISTSNVNVGVLVGVITCVCVSVFGHKATCVFEPVFSAFLIT